MKRAGREKRETGSSSKLRAERPVDLAKLRQEIRNLVGNAALEMVKNGIEEANQGHYAAMKFLFELVGLTAAAPEADKGEEEGGLAEVLFRRLGIVEGDGVTNVCPAGSGGGSDAVK